MTSMLLASAVFAALWRIVLPENPQIWEKNAARELGEYLDKAVPGGIVISEGEKDTVFHVGDTSYAKSNKLASSSFKDEEWAVKSFGRNVVFNGGGTRGCLYSVYRFLEDKCGVRWWTDTDEDVPQFESLNLGKLDMRGRPHFGYREIHRGGKECDHRTVVRNRLNGNGNGRNADIPIEWGGGYEYGPPFPCHVWDRYFPFEQDSKAHPEWFALVKGERKGGQTVAQLCLTCPGLAEEFAARVLKMVESADKDAKKKGVSAPRIYDLSQNDNKNFCTCEPCMAETEKYGHSGRQIRFLNKVVDIVSSRRPGLTFSTLAYHYSEPPPKGEVKARSNLVVRLCNTRQDMMSPLNGEVNAFMRDQVKAWGAYTENLSIWDYQIAFNDNYPVITYPVPSEYLIPEKFRFFAENKVSGAFLQHECMETADMWALKFHLECRLLEDPFQDGDALMHDFHRRYYGAAAEKMLAYRDKLFKMVRERNCRIYIWYAPPAEFNYIRDEDFSVLESMLLDAERAVVGDAKRLARIGKVRTGLANLKDYRKGLNSRLVTDKAVSSEPFFDFPVKKEDYRLSGNKVKIVDDAAASTGKAVEISAEISDSSPLPLKFGMYDKNLLKLTEIKHVDELSENPDEYAWYDLGRMTIPGYVSYLYCVGWAVQIPFGHPEMAGKKVDAKVRMRFSGPAYGGKVEDKNTVWIDRVAFIPVR